MIDLRIPITFEPDEAEIWEDIVPLQSVVMMKIVMSREEVDVFCIDSDDIGNVTECKVKIQLKDQAPVQKTYYSMPKPLHLEVKHCI